MEDFERRNKLLDAVWYWFPVRWIEGTNTYEISDLEISDNGIALTVVKNRDFYDKILFTDEECYGDNRLVPSSARTKIYEELR